ncbi:ATP-binding protein [Coleofasciculus sp.]|uniref:ATP-binding protein n=1 Tax=Coleofasciculus sp. TaxID=3100458 RepID=UPI0039F7CA1A
MSSVQPSCPFIVGVTIADSRFFVGRQEELQRIVSQMTGVLPGSLNVVGRRRIGKSWLLYHFCQTYQEYLSQPHRFISVYLSLQNPQSHGEEGFYQVVGRLLWNHPQVQRQPGLVEALRVQQFNRLAFSSAMGHWKRQGVLAVLCLDDFEVLMRHYRDFDDGFFDNLRSLIDSGALMVVVASPRKLEYYQHRYRLTSPFFKLSQVLALGELREEEAWELVSLSDTQGKEGQAALSPQDQKLAKQLGGTHPFLLQLAGSLLWEARQQRRDINWVKARFEVEARRTPGYSFELHQLPLPLQVLVRFPLNLGRMVRGIRGTVDEIGNLMVGTAILIGVILVVLVLLRLLF